MKRVFFYDTWAFVALANRRDPAHAVAADLDALLEQQGYAAATSDYVLDETLTLLNVAAGAKAALLFLDDFEARVAAGELQLLTVDPERRERALAIFRKLVNSETRLSFTDATSFAVMQELSIRDAFTADAHFHRAGHGIRPLIQLDRRRFRAAAVH